MSIVIQKTWGREEIIHNGDYCCKKLVYTKPVASSLHYHETKHETFVVAAGEFDIETHYAGVDKQHKKVGPGWWVVLPPGVQHRIRCLEPGFLVEASTHDNPEDCVRLEPSEQ